MSQAKLNRLVRWMDEGASLLADAYGQAAVDRAYENPPCVTAFTPFALIAEIERRVIEVQKVAK